MFFLSFLTKKVPADPRDPAGTAYENILAYLYHSPAPAVKNATVIVKGTNKLNAMLPGTVHVGHWFHFSDISVQMGIGSAIHAKPQI